MIPEKLSLSGFLSYRDPVEIDFTGFDLACISGPNGAGKSSLLDGITWALFGHARKRDDSVINTRSEAAEVEFTFKYEDNIYRVLRAKQRNKTAILEFHIQVKGEKWKPLTEPTMRSTESLIRETLRLDYETFVNASFFLQGKADQFTQQRTGDRKRILSSILGLEIWESYRKKAVEQNRSVESEITELEGRLQEINNELSQEDQRKEKLAHLQKELQTVNQALGTEKNALDELKRAAAALAEQEKLVSTLAGHLEHTRQELDKHRARLAERKSEQKELNGLLERSDELEKSFKELQQTRQELDRWNEIASQFNQQEKQRQAPLTEIETSRTKLEGEREQLQHEQKTITESEEEQAELLQERKNLEEQLSALKKKTDERVRLEKERQEAAEALARAQGENPSLKDEMERLKSRLDQLKESDSADCPTCGQSLKKGERQALIKKTEAEGKEKGDQFRANQAVIKAGDQRIKELDEQVKALAGLDDKERELTRKIDQLNDHLKRIEQSVKGWNKQGAVQLAEVEKKLEQGDYAEDARRKLAAIDAELKKIGYQVDAHDELRQKVSSLAKSESEYWQLEKARAALTPLEREIEELEKQNAALEKSLAEQEQDHTQAAAILAEAQAQAPNVAQAENEMLKMQEQENRLRIEVGAAQQEVDVLDTLRTRKQEITQEREVLAQKVSQLKAVERAFGKDGVPAMLIEQALPHIQNRANEVLERLSGGSMSVAFITQQEYKDKNRDDLRETLDIQISDSAGIRDYEMYSGGEAFRINFAIRLALAEVLAQRAGARLQTLVVDEGFGSQDEAGRQRLIEAINLVKDDFAKILVITHIDALKDAFPTRIEVEKTARGSIVTVI